MYEEKFEVCNFNFKVTLKSLNYPQTPILWTFCQFEGLQLSNDASLRAFRKDYEDIAFQITPPPSPPCNNQKTLLGRNY